ncbi:hypothetical protein [Microbacterium sp. SA39]|uniref:hypothetical protein n=1 Tax=Microbacterium sp. SA39 TaxID=1263625 RepID=UPI0005F9D83B|nr:hypothetical protein [Microbacterium sp. SA39]KJQ52970.1 hypothetical protein RS85_03047 [Microbacterium sp. SA39]
MGLLNFGKKKRASEFDPDLDDLTIEEADLLRRTFAQRWPASEGTITLHGEYAESSSGAQYGLYNLSRAVKLEPQENWPQVIERHISGVLSRRDEPKDNDLSDDEVLSLVKARLIPSSYLPDTHKQHFTYRYVVAEGLEAILMLDYPESATALPDGVVSRFDAEALWTAGIAALAQEATDEAFTMNAGSGQFLIVSTESLFTASHALDFPSFLPRFGVSEAPRGVLFAVPSRHHLVFHVVEGPNALTVASDMRGFAQKVFGDHPGEISREVFYWGASGYEKITSVDADDQLTVDGTGAFFDAINRV